jgi:DNA-binding response OmpR family regulator
MQAKGQAMMDEVQTLIVDDEEGIRYFLTEVFEPKGHAVTTAASGEEALEKLRQQRFDLLLLDLRLGGRVDGMRVLEAVRWRWPGTTVIILTAYGNVETAMQAIQEGVDGYVLKPVKPRDVRQVVQEALDRRRTFAAAHKEEAQEHLVEHGPFFVDLDKHLVTRDGEKLDLTPQEFTLLTHLISNAHRVVEPPELVRVVRGYESESIEEARNIVKWYIHRLRHKIEPTPSDPQYILNVRGVGYRFRGEEGEENFAT